MVVLRDTFTYLFEISTKFNDLSLPTLKECSISIAYEDFVKNIKVEYGGKRLLLPFARSEVYNATIKSWRHLTLESTDCKSIYEVTFDVQDSNFSFKAGDTIGLIPQNRESEVNAILSHLDLNSKADCKYSLTTSGSTKIAPHIPVKGSLRYVLTHCVEIRSVLKKLFLFALSKYTNDEKERKVLEYLSSKEGSSCYNTHVLNKNLNILDIFTTFKTCKPPVEILLNNLSRLLPRPYSIVNSGLTDPSIIKICFSVMRIGPNRTGLTTGWLEEIILSETTLDRKMMKLDINHSKDVRIPIFLRSNMSGFILPDNDVPLVLVGPGTGVSPFIGFLEEREFLSKKQEMKSDVWLFFGCRHPNLDFLYEEELKSFKDKGVLTKLSTAFSRLEACEEKYVQDSILSNGKEVANLLAKGAFVCICGDLKTIATQVRQAFIQCLSKYLNFSIEDAEKYIQDMEAKKKYITDVWS